MKAFGMTNADLGFFGAVAGDRTKNVRESGLRVKYSAFLPPFVPNAFGTKKHVVRDRAESSSAQACVPAKSAQLNVVDGTRLGKPQGLWSEHFKYTFLER